MVGDVRRVLVVNTGSSSTKVSLVVDGAVTDRWSSLDVPLPDVDAVAHRFVHGGEGLGPVALIDNQVRTALEAAAELAPLHQGRALEVLDMLQSRLPQVPHVACFDSAFHATLPPEAATYALPAEWNERYHIRRYGFHGFSHAWAARRAREWCPGARRVVTCHLGSGASLAAVCDGISVDTTMGFTPLEGLVMATRSGDVDPGLVLWLAEREPDVAAALASRSGLLGLAGTADMREILARDDEQARLARTVYLHRLRKGIAAMAAAMGGIDVCIFTGGVGENAPQIRAGAADGLEFLGISIDPERNQRAVPDEEISASGARVRTLVVAAQEDRQIAEDVRLFFQR